MASAAMCFEVLGEGMDEVFPSGSLLECVDYAELGREPAHGDYVLAEHQGEAGETKISCFRYLITDDGSILVNQPKEMGCQLEISLDDYDEDDSYKIVAYVMSYQSSD